jgi:hypothetical protein
LDITGSKPMADFIGISKSGKSAVVMETTVGSKTLEKVKKQLENGLSYLSNKNFKGKVKVYVRTTDPRFAKEVEKELKAIGRIPVKVILDGQ